METIRVLYNYIMDQYGSVVNFAEKSGISLIDLNAVLLKDNVSEDICIGLKLCEVLNIDINKLVFDNQVKERENEKSIYIPKKIDKAIKINKPGESNETTAKCEIYNKCMRLSEIEKQEVLEYIDRILNEKEEQD